MAMRIEQVRNSARPTVVGRHYAAACGHYLATAAATAVLQRGGNAVDAGVTASMAMAVLQPNVVSFAGVAPTLIYLRKDQRVVSLAGLGYWPAATDIVRLAAEGGDCIPDGILRTVVPAAPATHIEALRRFGTISFEEAARPACELARDGFAMYPLLAYNIESVAHSPSQRDGIPVSFDRYPENSRIFRPGGRTPAVGEIFRQEDLARTIFTMTEAERNARGDRDKKLRAAHDCFYRGPIADAIAEYHAECGGFLRKDDLARFEAPVEESISCNYRGFEVHSCDAWCQGIVLLETLKILEGFNIRALEHNSVAYIHAVAEAFNLAFADREAYVGDPKFVKVPTSGLLSDTYAELQRKRIDPHRAFGKMPSAGDPWGHGTRVDPRAPIPAPAGEKAQVAQDTIYGCVVDGHGNAYSCTPSDDAYDTPIVPGTGLAVSSRGNQSRLQAGHPSEVRPGKRPRLTPTPGLALRDGQLYLVFGTPGGDIQCQSMLQVLFNIAEFGMSVQQAVESPRFGTFNFPNSFAPHQYLPGRLFMESSVAAETVQALREKGHDIELWPSMSPTAGSVCAILRHPETGLFHGGADPRREGYAIAW